MYNPNYLTKNILENININYKFILASYLNDMFNGFSRNLNQTFNNNCICIQAIRDIDFSFIKKKDENINIKIFIIPKEIKTKEYREYIINNFYSIPKLLKYFEKIHLYLYFKFKLPNEIIKKIIDKLFNQKKNIWEFYNIKTIAKHNQDNLNYDNKWLKLDFFYKYLEKKKEYFLSNPTILIKANLI